LFKIKLSVLSMHTNNLVCIIKRWQRCR